MGWKPIFVSDQEARSASRNAARRAKFQLDESIDPLVAKVLREKGFNVRTAAEVGLSGHADEDHLATAKRDDRILLTHDEDFLNNRRFPPSRNPGLVVVPGGAGDIGALGDSLQIVALLVAPYRETWRGAKIKITADGYITIWNRDQASGRYRETRYRMTANGPALRWEDDGRETEA